MSVKAANGREWEVHLYPSKWCSEMCGQAKEFWHSASWARCSVFLPQLVHWFTINNSWLFGTGPWILIGGHNITKHRAQDLPGWNCLHVFFSFGKSLCFYQIISTMCIVDMWGQSGYAISHNHPSWIRSVFVLIMPCRQVIQVFISLSSHCPFPIKFPRCKFFTCILMVWSQLLYRTFPTGWGCFYGAPM